MLFKTKFLRDQEKIEKIKQQGNPWKKEFAWFPMEVEDHLVWLEFVEYQYDQYLMECNDLYKKYRLIDAKNLLSKP